MTRLMNLRHEFVEFIPEELADGIVYVSIPYATVAHRCCCGCGTEVVTPLSPTDWKLIFNGEAISLSPSIGNWGAPCQSHYWITEDRVRWAAQWSPEQIAATRAADRFAKEQRYSRNAVPSASDRERDSQPGPVVPAQDAAVSIWQRVWRWFS